MSASGYTPIQLYRTTTASAVPSAVNLSAGELAINTTDGKLYYKTTGGTVDLIAANVTPIANGGTGQTSKAAGFNALSPITSVGDIIIGNGSNSSTRLAIGANGYVLTSDGTTASWSAPAAAVSSFSAGTTGLTPSTGTTGAITLAGTLAIANGGTGQTTKSAAFNALSPITSTGDLILGNGTNSATRLAIGTNGQILTTNGTTASWGATVSGATLNGGYTEQVYAVSGTTPALSPTNGSIQTWTLSGSSTPTAGTWAEGQSLTLMVDDGTAYTITWASLAVTWKTDSGSAPTLQTTGYTAIQLWKVGSTIYGARVGNN